MTQSGKNKHRKSATSNTRQTGVVLKPYCNGKLRGLFLAEDGDDLLVAPEAEKEKAGWCPLFPCR